MKSIRCPDIVPLLACPRCGTGEPLESGSVGLVCRICKVQYPSRDGVPLLYRDQLPTPDVLYQTGASGGMCEADKSPRVRPWLDRMWSRVRYLFRRAEGMLTPRNPASTDYWELQVRTSVKHEQQVAVLDLGGGDGRYRHWLASERDTYVILEPDVDAYFVRENRERHAYVIGDGHDRLFRDQSFDIISMFDVLEHIRDPFVLMENCGKWLKPGGMIVLSVPQYWHVHGWPNDYYRYTISGLRELVRRAGLEVENFWAMGGPCVLLWSMIDLNFSSVLRLPLVRNLVHYPLLYIARLGDRMFFAHNLDRQHPDTRGWMLVARKATESTRKSQETSRNTWTDAS